MIDLVDEAFVAAAPSAVAAVVHDPATWRRWWPGLALTVFMDRGDQGLRWTVTGAMTGTAEIWLEAVGDGVVLHHYLRVDLRDAPQAGSSHQRWGRVRSHPDPAVVAVAYTRAFKRQVWALKDRLETGRRPGEPAAGAVPDEVGAPEFGS